jgi:hypothetical protein
MFLINLILFINLLYLIFIGQAFKSIMANNNNEIVSRYTFKKPIL